MSDRARSAGAEQEGGDAEVAAKSPARKAIFEYFTGRANANPDGDRQASAGGESDGRDERSSDGRDVRSNAKDAAAKRRHAATRPSHHSERELGNGDQA